MRRTRPVYSGAVKICYLGDANVQVRRISEHFAARGHDVHLVTARPGPIAGVTVHAFSGGPLARRAAFILGIPRARALVRALQPDVVHAFYATSYGLVSSFIPGPPVVLSPMGTDVLISSRQSRASAFMVRRAIARADLILSVAGNISRRVIEMGADPARVETFPRGVNLDLFSFRPRAADGAPVIISNRKLEPVYNVEQLIRAMPAVLRRHPKARARIVGDGFLRPQLEQLAASEGAAASISFEGDVDHGRVPELLAQGDLYVSCSRSDGTSACLLEAMATGLFPVVSDIESNRDWIRSGEQGVLVPLDEPQLLAAAITEALDSAERRRSAAEANRAMIEARASWKTNMNRIEALYARLGKPV